MGFGVETHGSYITSSAERARGCGGREQNELQVLIPSVGHSGVKSVAHGSGEGVKRSGAI